MIKKLFKESFVYGLSRYIGKFIGIFLLPLYTAVLTPEDYGILDLLSTIAVVSSFLVISGTDSALGYYFFRKEYESEKKEMISTALWLRLGMSFSVLIVLAIFSPILSHLVFGRNYEMFIIITGFTLVFSSVYSFLFDLVRFEFRPWFYTVVSTGGILIQILLTVYFVLILKLGVYGALMGSMLGYLCFFAVTVIYTFRRYKLSFSYKWTKKILRYGFPLIGTGIAVWILNSTDRYFLAYYSDLSSVGIYAVGMKMAAFIGMVGGAIQLAWGPFAMSIQYEENAKEIYAEVIYLYFIINIVLVTLISLFSLDVLKVFTQPAYYEARAVIPLLCFSTVFWSGYFFAATGINIMKKLQHTIWITFVACGINILLNFFLTKMYGGVAAAFSIMTANLVILVLTFLSSQKFYKIELKYLRLAIQYIIGTALIFIAYYFNINMLQKVTFSILFISFITYLNFGIVNKSYKFVLIAASRRK